MIRKRWHQERMQSKVRYWQHEAIHARGVAERHIRLLAASTGGEPEPPDRPAAGIG
jgi:hypothetical protein